MARIVIVGGGVMGSSLAWWLTREPGARDEITVIERDPTYREASSALSASGIRQQYSEPVNIEIGRFGVAFLRGIAPQAGLIEQGYLYLAGPEGAAILRERHLVQRRHGAEVALLDTLELGARFPWLNLEGIELGSLGLRGEGWFDGYSLFQLFRRGAREAGVRYLKGEATGLRCRGSRVTAVSLAAGGDVEADIVVNAAGPWSARLMAPLGIDLPVRPRRRTVFVVDCPHPLSGMPLVIDPSGIWFRPEGASFLVGAPAPPEIEDGDQPLDPELEVFEPLVWPALAHRVPAFEELRLRRAWAGYYEYNTFDQNGLVGPWPGLPNLFLMTGFSGHGLQQAPAVGRGLAELIRHGRYTSLDLAALGPQRLADGLPLVERNVI